MIQNGWILVRRGTKKEVHRLETVTSPIECDILRGACPPDSMYPNGCVLVSGSLRGEDPWRWGCEWIVAPHDVRLQLRRRLADNTEQLWAPATKEEKLHGPDLTALFTRWEALIRAELNSYFGNDSFIQMNQVWFAPMYEEANFCITVRMTIRTEDEAIKLLQQSNLTNHIKVENIVPPQNRD